MEKNQLVKRWKVKMKAKNEMNGQCEKSVE